MTILFQDFKDRKNTQDLHTAVTEMSDHVVIKVLMAKLRLTHDQARCQVALGKWTSKYCWESGDGDYVIRMLKEDD